MANLLQSPWAIVVCISLFCCTIRCSWDQFDLGHHNDDYLRQFQASLLNPFGYESCHKGAFRHEWMKKVNNFQCDKRQPPHRLSTNYHLMADGGKYQKSKRIRKGSKRIIDGYFAEPGEFPSFVQLVHLFHNGTGEQAFCGGVLLNEFLVLTAAHCAMVRRMAYVFAGGLELGKGTVRRAGQVCMPQEFEVQMDYSKPLTKMPEHDWAIVELAEPLAYTEHIQPACVNLDFKLNSNSLRCVAVGHGATSVRVTNETVISRRLKAASVRQCNLQDLDPFNLLGRLTQGNQLEIPGRICTTPLTLHGDHPVPGQACRGDSGGPLYCFDNCSGTPKMFVAGLAHVSNLGGPDNACPSTGFTFFTNTASHRVGISKLIKMMVDARKKRRRQNSLGLLGDKDELLSSAGYRCFIYIHLQNTTR